jgi:AAA domain
MVMGCTTAGAAKNIKLIKVGKHPSMRWIELTGFQDWGPSTVIVEEAGQVLEVHTLASLVDSVQHLVLVGDHFQLRPPISNYGRPFCIFMIAY